MAATGIAVTDIGIFLGALISLALFYYFFVTNSRQRRVQKRIKRLKARKNVSIKAGSSLETGSLRRKGPGSVPLVGAAVKSFNLVTLQDRIERAGRQLSPEKYLTLSLLLFFVTTVLVTVLTKQNPLIGIFVGIIVAIGIPHIVLSILIGARLKKFLLLFPDAIDLIVRGLRSGLPVAESINMVSKEVQDPLGTIFTTMTEQMKLGVTMEKTLFDTARKLGLTEFNFFVTSIILQRETGGNLSEILSNLSDVLRKRFMMRMKIKALSSEAKASAMIVGALPFMVALALYFTSPGYLDPLVEDRRGNMAAGGAALSMVLGIAVMAKMTRFEI